MARRPPKISQTERQHLIKPAVQTGVEVAGEMSDLERALVGWRREPMLFIKDVFQATPEDYQEEMLLDLFVRGHNRLAAKSSHGTGKTTTLAWAGWFFLMTRALSRVVATAPVQAQLRDVLWPEFAKWHAVMPDQLRDMWDMSSEHIRHKAAPNEWFAVARTSNKPENLQGFHNENLLIIIDEASAVPANVFEVIEGALSDAEGKAGESKLAMMGNPNFASGELFDAFGKNKHLYRRYTLSGDPHTKFTSRDGKAYVSKRVSALYRRTIGEKYGYDGPIYDVRVRGKFPAADDRAILPMEWLERAQYLPLPHFDDVADGVIIALDPARYGDDESALCVTRKNAVIKLQTKPKQSTVENARWVDEEICYWEGEGIPVIDVRVDEPGLGGGVIDILRADPKDGGFGRAVTAYNGGRGLMLGVDPEDEIRQFMNRRSRDYWHLRLELENQSLVLPVDETMVNQGASLHYEIMDNQKIKAESKQKLKARLGPGSSPDRIDVIVIARAPGYSMADEVASYVSAEEIIYGRKRDRVEEWM